MASNDAEMSATPDLGDDLKQISEHIASLRGDLETLAGDVGRLGSHQLDRMQNTANAAMGELGDAVRRNPLTALAIAAGVGFLYGILTRR